MGIAAKELRFGIKKIQLLYKFCDAGRNSYVV
jgi:hypothetical protein